MLPPDPTSRAFVRFAWLTWAAAGWVVTACAAPAAAAPFTVEQPANHLVNERSPYLLEHAHNPVNWYPWGNEAFEKARREGKPVFLSIGYSACHWCHVMAQESFENPEVARLLNENFVCIKVDREERPDVDAVYVNYVEATTGSAGWPLTVFLTPELKPFFGGVYFPPEDRPGLPGLKPLLGRITTLWRTDRDHVEAGARQAVAELQARAAGQPSSAAPDRKNFDTGYRQFADAYDAKYGGFGDAPKFPRPVTLDFLFHAYARSPQSAEGRRSLEMALFTLRQLAAGGIHDQLGGGFHRYATDRIWQVPHFEKMLYDQAQLASAYLTAYQITHEVFFAAIARDILDYVRRDLTDEAGGFYSAEDADSPIHAGQPERAEGVFYLWKCDEILAQLGPDRGKVFAFHYGVAAGGNVRSDPHGEFAGKNILAASHTVAETAAMFKLSEATAAAMLAESRRILFEGRAQRPRPRRDDKIVTAWNGLMISAFARGAQVLDEPAYLESARRAAAFIHGHLYRESDHQLWRSYRGGPGAATGFAADHAFLTQGLLDLYEASFDVTWLAWARELQATQDALFWDERNGGYFDTTGLDASVLLRTKEEFDGPEPSPNSVSVLNLMRLAALFDDQAARTRAEKTVAAFSRQLVRSPGDLPLMLVGADWLWGSSKQVVIAGQPGSADTRALLAELHRHFVPKMVVMLADGGAGQKFFAAQVPFFTDIAPAGNATAYVCENFRCHLPTSKVAEFAGLLEPPGARAPGSAIK